jgi:hypothetical protein
MTISAQVNLHITKEVHITSVSQRLNNFFRRFLCISLFITSGSFNDIISVSNYIALNVRAISKQ